MFQCMLTSILRRSAIKNRVEAWRSILQAFGKHRRSLPARLLSSFCLPFINLAINQQQELSITLFISTLLHKNHIITKP